MAKRWDKDIEPDRDRIESAPQREQRGVTIALQRTAAVARPA
jgi:hypothetical protein